MKILLLAGGKSIERDVSLRSGQAVAASLKRLGYDYEVFDPVCSDEELVAKARAFDFVFIALHGKPGEDGTIQKLLEDNNIPFQGSGSKASELCIDKQALKDLLIKNDVPVPIGKLVTQEDLDDEIFLNPYVLKPVSEGSTLDTQIVRSPSEVNREQRQLLLQKYSSMLAEELITGPEITVGVFDDKALPVIEIIPPADEEFDYENKYNGKTQELLPPKNVSKELQKQAQDLAVKVHRLAGCEMISRADFMISGDVIYTLETNTIPGMTEQSLLPKMIRAAGYTFDDFIDVSIKSALPKKK